LFLLTPFDVTKYKEEDDDKYDISCDNNNIDPDVESITMIIFAVIKVRLAA